MDTGGDAGGTGLTGRLAEVDTRIAAAARTVGRDPAGLTRIVVTKFHPASLVRKLHLHGVRDIGENRQQEFTAKAEELSDLADLQWHFIGQVQTKKARAIRRSATVIHSVDRAKLVDALDRAADDEEPVLDVLIQINLTDDPARGGTSPVGLEVLAERVAATSSLALRGVMAVAPRGESPAAAFERLADYSGRVRGVVPTASWISAGMTGDFEEAVAAGATHLRIGSAITGTRQARV